MIDEDYFNEDNDVYDDDYNNYDQIPRVRINLY